MSHTEKAKPTAQEVLRIVQGFTGPIDEVFTHLSEEYNIRVMSRTPDALGHVPGYKRADIEQKPWPVTTALGETPFIAAMFVKSTDPSILLLQYARLLA